MKVTLAPQVKFIIILRDPIARAMSYLSMAKDLVNNGATPHLRLQSLVESFDACAARNTDCSEAALWENCRWGAGISDPIVDGLYDLQIASWLALYPDRDFCIVDNEHFRANQSLVLATIERFIGLPPHQDTVQTHLHKGPVPPARQSAEDLEATELLASFFKRHGTFFYDHVRAHGFWGCEPHVSA